MLALKVIDMALKIVKTRDVVVKLVDDSGYPVVLDDEEVNEMVEDIMSEDMVDEEGNKCQPASISSGNTMVRIHDNHFEKFTDAMKSIPPDKLQEIKEQIRAAIQKDPLLGSNLVDTGIDIDNFENYLGSVEALTIERRRVYNVYKVQE